MALIIGINFRSTSGYVTDGTNETYCLADQYPVTRGGATFGWTTWPYATTRDRSTSVDHRLAGINSQQFSWSPGEFRLDLNTTGNHDIRAAVGDAGFSHNNQYCELRDGSGGSSATFKTLDTATAADEFIDASGVVRSGANWPSQNVKITHNFTNAELRLTLQDPALSSGDTSNIAHLFVEEVSGGGGGPAASPTRTLMGVGT